MIMSDVRLIDANALMDTIRQHEYQLATRLGSIDYGMFTLGIQQAVDEQPTINPEDYRPQGRWIETNWAEHDGHGEVITRYEITALKCSNCCCCFKKEALWRRNCCPNCGADMRGDASDEK